MRTLRPTEHVYAFYDGRDGSRFSAQPNWIDAGALSLGIASYAIVDRDEALVYDTHVSVDRARHIRETLEADGVQRFTVLLSHWHLDHVAGNAAFADCEILAGARTCEHLTRRRAAIESGTTHEGPPPIDPLVMPTRTLHAAAHLTIGALKLELLPFEIHSDDATVVWMPDEGLLLAADTLEDTITYVDEPERLVVHLAELDCLAALGAERILPSHGDPDRISAGGYEDGGLIRATQIYVGALLRMRDEPALRDVPLRELLSEPLAAGRIVYHRGYEDVHEENVRAVVGPSAGSS
jgi:glyoxylase-like metal-dependent hydrolase (beta-lactamase superfamily II)